MKEEIYFDDEVWLSCYDCSEEYLVPESYVVHEDGKCPICNGSRTFVV